MTLKNKMRSIPVTVYYKYEFKESKFSVLGGVGLTLIDVNIDMNIEMQTGQNASQNTSKAKTSPHIAGGLEYRFSKLLALSLDLKYTINSEIEQQLFTVSFKRGLGFQGALTVRFYAF
jgi:opacity protein-like surface antigen